MRLERARAEELSALILANLFREYPNKLSFVLRGDDDLLPPRTLSPVFYGCFDWHSAVHSHFALVRILRLFEKARFAQGIVDALDRSLRAEAVEGELRTLSVHPSFEVPYGLAWLLILDAELARGGGEPFDRWRHTLAPLVALAAERMMKWSRELTLPIRTGEHNQTAFSLGLLLDWAANTDEGATDGVSALGGAGTRLDALRARAATLYLNDRAAPIAYEPSAHDFLSPALAEADVMSRVLPHEPFVAWLDAFLPDPLPLSPATPVERSDGKLVHVDGLNVSRSWMLRNIARALPATGERRTRLLSIADGHERAGLAGISGAHYAGSHWLPTFAVVCKTGGIIPDP